MGGYVVGCDGLILANFISLHVGLRISNGGPYPKKKPLLSRHWVLPLLLDKSKVGLGLLIFYET